MRPISIDELKEHARELPPASRARGERHCMMRRGRLHPSYYEYAKQPCNDFTYDKLEFHANRGCLDGTVVWYWTHRDVIVRVDI
jgi:hypothetical protein